MTWEDLGLGVDSVTHTFSDTSLREGSAAAHSFPATPLNHAAVNTISEGLASRRKIKGWVERECDNRWNIG